MADATTAGNLPATTQRAEPGQPGQSAGRRPTLRARRGKELVDEVAGLIAGAGPGPGEEDEDEQPGDGEQHPAHQAAQDDDDDEASGQREKPAETGDAPATWEDLKRSSGLSWKQFNAIPVADGLTLGQLKDKVPELAKLEADRAEFEDRRTATELEQIDGHRRLMSLVDELPANSIPPGLLRRLEVQHEEKRAREADMLNKARPQWGEPKYASAERDVMMKVASTYGFSRAEVASIMDHRQVLLLQDFAHALARIEAAKGAARRVETVGDKQLTTDTTRAADGGRPGPNGTGVVGTSKKAQLSRRVADLIARG